MNESSKSKLLRKDNFLDKFLKGDILDIGAGDDKIVEDAESFDKIDGNANELSKYLNNEKRYDTIYSSHCLEHLNNPKKALREWFFFLKKGGHLIIIVPDEDLYEQNIWPSYFSQEHNWSFTLNNNSDTKMEKSINLYNLIKESLKGEFDIVLSRQESINYNHKLKFKKKKYNKKDFLYKFLTRIAKKSKFVIFKDIINYILISFGYPIDQTYIYDNRLAQILVIVKKN